ncbi:MAG TPA: FG-GAP-like repeat-containing protein [Candidatus Binatia bacterium]|jgi:hypothetical protein|nr:FG-GAP-like repeat-containing protein [Candidatus Binatia bacterium]
MGRSSLLATLVALALPVVAAAQLQVVTTVPQLNAVAPANTAIVVAFDRALDTSSVTIDTFRVFGRYSGAVRGSWTFSNGNKNATLTPDEPFSAGEMVYVNLSHDLTAADTTTLRSAGWAWQFEIATVPSAATFHETQQFSNRTGGNQTRIYGAAASDFNDDGYLDLATVNEVSADVRVFLNHADGSNQFGPMRPPQEIGVEASPNETADFDNDGKTDMCVAAATSGTVSILLGAGNGSFSSATDITVGSEPHGIWPVDVDGDGDLDVVNCNVGSNNMSLLINNGNGVFGSPTFFEGGVNGEYGLYAADMNADGITDLVIAGRNGSEINTMLGNGNGTFTASGAAQPTGGNTWVVVLGDVDGDGNLDAATANDGSGTVSVLKGLGNGRFAAPSTINIGAHTPAVDLGDLDGDGDPDMVVSSYGGGFWRWFRNDGTGAFTFVEEFDAVSNPSCAVLFDADNDGDLDLALSDEIADVVKILENENGGASTACTPTPSSCLAPIQAKKSSIQLKNKTPDTGDGLTWKWTKGAVTAKADFGNPVATDSYALCMYENGALVQSWEMPAGQMCGTKPCWRDIGKGFSYSDKDLTPDGIQSLKITEGLLAGKAKITLKGKGSHLGLAGLDGLTGVLDVQLQKSSGGVCWGATFSPPFQKQDASQLKAVSDVAVVTTTTTSSTTTTTLPASFFALHANTIGTTCGGCHGASGFGGLSGLDECHTAYAALVSIASTENPTMFRVTPGSPTTSWIMHKLDNTHTAFAAQCVGGFCGSSMPLGSPLLPIAFRDALRQWITDGAVNDCW